MAYSTNLANVFRQPLQLTQGVIHALTLTNDPEQLYYLYLPENIQQQSKVFITVHGISRNAEQHAKCFLNMAEKYNVVLIAPCFPVSRFPDYQRLGRVGRGKRADLKLLEIVEEVKQMCNLTVEKLYLSGFSGGAQFVHRFAMAYPRKVAKTAICAAGWYTLPNYKRRFPYGLKTSPSLADLAFDLNQFLTIPSIVFVGEYDVYHDDALNRSPKITHIQGADRLERGRNWIDAMRSEALRRQLNTNYRFQLLDGAGHSFIQCIKKGKLDRWAFSFLFDEKINR